LTISEVFVPTYSYACTECDNRFDEVQAFSDAALTTCPKCSGRLRKLFGNVGVVFKGSGFYRNDSRSSSKSAARDDKKSEKSEKSEASASSASDSSTSKDAKDKPKPDTTKKDTKTEAKSA
jgi:putative FmdB family regulatory protein